MKHEGLGKRKKTQCSWKETVQQEKKERTNEESSHKESEHQEGT